MSDRAALMGTGFEEKTEQGAGIPVLKARGRFASMDVITKESKDIDPNTGKPREYKQVVHKMVDLEVLETKEGTEFPFDSLEFFISTGTKEGTAYHAWVESIKAALPNVDWNETVDTGEVDDTGEAIMENVWASYAKIYDDLLDGNVVLLDRTQTVMMRRPDKSVPPVWEEKPIPVWKVASVEGAGSTAVGTSATPVEAALALVGASENVEAFRNAALGSSAVASDEQLLLQLASQTDEWLAEQVAAGTLVAAGGWYSVA